MGQLDHLLHSDRYPNIIASVGRNGANHKSDVLLLQQALNKAPDELGGAKPPLNANGVVDPKTIAAIETFQRFHFPERYGDNKPDGRMDPEGDAVFHLKNMCSLVDVYGTGTVDFWNVRLPTRLARAKLGVNVARQAASTSRRKIESAMDHLRGKPDFTGLNAAAFRLASFHFALGKLTPAAALGALENIRRTFISVMQAIDGGLLRNTPVGGDIFGVDTRNTTAIAYSPTLRGHAGDLDPYMIYLCDGIDAKSPDAFNLVLLHELVHMSDDETPGSAITDHGYREKAFKLSHDLRMRNSDNYAIFGTHALLGRTALIAVMPMLASVIPDKI